MQFEAITEKIIGSAYQVYNHMGFGFLESVYENCMAIELRQSGLTVHQQHPINVHYRGKVVGEFYADVTFTRFRSCPSC